MSEILLTVTQALQMVGLAPCIFVIAFLLCASRPGPDHVVPILYFVGLGFAFLLPLLGVFIELTEWPVVQAVLLVVESMIPALSFLLIIQFVVGRIPPFLYWFILLLPLVGGTSFIYLSLQAQEVCIDQNRCVMTEDLRTLYNVFASALIFLLLIFGFTRSQHTIAVDDVERMHKYWLIIALIALNQLILAIDLFRLSDAVSSTDALLAVTVIRIGFIYLVLTSIFRLFYDLFAVELMPKKNDADNIKQSQKDQQAVAMIDRLMQEEHLFREMGLTRQALAKKLQLSEHQVSRIINTHFHKNFNELVNDYRIEEAKNRLKSEPDTQITVIAFEVGFNSIASFNRVFKELVGSSPTAYRRFHANSVPS